MPNATVEESKYNLHPLLEAAIAKERNPFRRRPTCHGRLATTTVETFPDNRDVPRVSPDPPVELGSTSY